jgi:hypothetical protein
MVPMSEPFDPHSVQFTEAEPETPPPDFRASEDAPQPPEPSPLPPKKRFLNRPGSADSATRKERAQRAGKEKKPLPPIPRLGFAPQIERAYKSLSLVVTPYDVKLGEAIFNVAPEAALAWDDLARQNEAVRRFIVWATSTTAAGAVLQAHSPIIGLMFARAMGDDKRISMKGALFAQQAERYANGEDPGQVA